MSERANPALSEREIEVLRALPSPAMSGKTGVQLVHLKGVSPFPEVHRLIEIGLAERRGRCFFARTRAGEMWVRRNAEREAREVGCCWACEQPLGDEPIRTRGTTVCSPECQRSAEWSIAAESDDA